MPDEPADDEIAQELEAPTDHADIWRARADEVDPARPFIQGDIFDAVTLPGFEDEPNLAMIIDHPCAMRSGVVLRERIQMLRVREEVGLPKRGWPRGQYRLMPLPALPRTGRHAAFFDETAMVPSDALDPSQRLACLSELGILILQQRLVHHLTRVVMRLPTLRTASIHMLEEVDLQEDWNGALSTPQPSETIGEALARATHEFDAFMNEPLASEGPARRDALKDELRRSAVRRAVQQEIRARSASGE